MKVNAVEVSAVSRHYRKKQVLREISFDVESGESVVIVGKNGCGKSSVINMLLEKAGTDTGEHPKMKIEESGTFEVAANLVISYINQDTSFLGGSLKDYAKKKNLDYSLFLSLLRQLDFEHVQFEKNMEDFSEGQKKKVLIAASLLTPAHLYIWDEPLNYIDVFSRMQIERLIEEFNPTMLLVEHDVRFKEKLGGRDVPFQNNVPE